MNPNIYLLWRHTLREALFLASLKKEGRGPAVLVRLVNQPLDRERLEAACREQGMRLVTLPMAFAGLREDDQVLRDAVLERLRAQDRTYAEAAHVPMPAAA